MECKVSGQFHYVTLIPMFTDTRTTKCKQLEQVQESGNAQLCWKKSNNYGRRKHAKCYPHLVLSTFYCFIANPLAVAICGNAWMRKTPSDFPLGFSLLCTTFGLLPSRKIWFTNKQHCGELGAHRPGNLLARFHLFSQFSDEKPKSATEKTNSLHFSNTSANVRLQKTNFFARKCVLRKRKESLGKRKIRITRHTKVSSTTNATKMKGFAPSATDCLKVFPLGVASCEKDILPTAMSAGKGGKASARKQSLHYSMYSCRLLGRPVPFHIEPKALPLSIVSENELWPMHLALWVIHEGENPMTPSPHVHISLGRVVADLFRKGGREAMCHRLSECRSTRAKYQVSLAKSAITILGVNSGLGKGEYRYFSIDKAQSFRYKLTISLQRNFLSYEFRSWFCNDKLKIAMVTRLSWVAKDDQQGRAIPKT